MSVEKIFILCLSFGTMASTDAALTMKLNPNDMFEKLAIQVLDKYFKDIRCVGIVSEKPVVDQVPSNVWSTFAHIIAKDPCGDPKMEELIKDAIFAKCEGFIVQMSEPTCFLKMWMNSIYKSNSSKPTVKLFYLPIHPIMLSPADTVFSQFESEISSEISAAALTQDSEWPVSLYTNNFNVRIGTEGRVHKIFVDRWHVDKGFEKNENLYPDKVYNMQGKVVDLATFDYKPYSSVNPIGGVEVSIVIEFCVRHNCTLQVTDDGHYWGTVYSNGTGDGILGRIHDGWSDFGVAAVYYWLEFLTHAQFSYPYMYGSVTVLVPKPVLLSGWRTPFLPFDLFMWLAYGLSVIAAAVFMYFITWATIKYTRFADAVIRKGQFVTGQDAFFRGLGLSVLQQPSIPLVPHTPIRHLFTSFEFLYLILSSIYAAELASYLTAPKYSKPIDTVKELADSGLKWYGDHNGWAYSLLYIESDTMKKIVDGFTVETPEKIKELSYHGERAYATERLPGGHFTELKYTTEHIISISHVMAAELYGSFCIVGIRKGSPYAYYLNQMIGWSVDAGLLEYWESAAARLLLSHDLQMAHKEAEKSHYKDIPKPLSISHIEGSLLVYFVGIVISTIVFLVEILFTVQNKAIKKFNVHSILPNENFN